MELIERKEISDVLLSARNQFIDIAVKNKSGSWSSHYYSVIDVREFASDHNKTTLVILTSINDSHCITVDLDNICGIKFNKYLNRDGHLIKEVSAVLIVPRLRIAY